MANKKRRSRHLPYPDGTIAVIIQPWNRDNVIDCNRLYSFYKKDEMRKLRSLLPHCDDPEAGRPLYIVRLIPKQ